MAEPVIRRALISVSDKTGLVEFASFLASRGIELLSTGGTAKALKAAGLAVREVSDHTGFPEIMDGRVKTLHPAIHGGILAVRGDLDHERAMREHKIAPIDLVVVNLYPFEATMAAGAEFDECIENIDIGGPAMIRAAAKNHAHVVVVVDPHDYNRVITEIKNHEGATSLGLRRRLAAAAFARTGAYDGTISTWFASQNGEHFPRRLAVGGRLQQLLRYGENPHQRAALYVSGDDRPGVATAEQLQGKELSYNNINDTDAAYELVAEFREPAVAIIKHANPCGVATAGDVVTAYVRALACDPMSAFGGIVALNRPLDGPTATEIAKLLTEVVIAPAADEAARAVFAAKKNLRLLIAGGLPDPAKSSMTLKSVAGGFLAQGRDLGRVLPASLRVVTKRSPNDRELADMMFGFTVCKHVKSNAIVYAKDGATVGIGAGQPSRVDSARIPTWKARGGGEAAGIADLPTAGSVAASDAFFPFPDGLIATADAGATAVIQPGGSMRDDEVIAAADKRDLAMVFTGMRHFRH